MKKLLLALFTLAIVLGTSCKKETTEPATDISKKEVFQKPLNGNGQNADAVPDGGGYGGYPGGQYVYPHSTGLCYCGQYSICHPYVHTERCLRDQAQGMMCLKDCNGVY